MNKYSTVALRIGLGIVFVYFGLGKMMHDIWFETIKAMPVFAFIGGGIDYFIYAVGVVEIITGLMLFVGYKIKFFAALASLQLITILILLKFGEIRDIGLLAASLALFFSGSDQAGADKKISPQTQP